MKFLKILLYLNILIITSCIEEDSDIKKSEFENQYENALLKEDTKEFNVSEMSENHTSIGQVIDDPIPTDLTFSIAEGNTNDAFAINSSTGVLTVNNSNELNFDLKKDYALSINVSDNNNNNELEQVTINILPETGTFKYQTYQKNGGKLPYRVMYPNEYDGNKKFPILFFLHGAGERGDNNEKQLTHGSSLFKDLTDKTKNPINPYPAIVVFPQCAKKDWWANNNKNAPKYPVLPDGFPRFTDEFLDSVHPSMGRLELLIDSLVKTNTVQTEKIYIIGMSMGGMGTAQILAKQPNRFAAAVVIAGIANTNKIFSENLAQTPTTIYHGLKDDVVSSCHSDDYFALIDKGNDRNRLIQFPNVNHLSWNQAFAQQDFLAWVFSHTNQRLD